VIDPGAEEEHVLRFVEMAHEQCYIANSLKTEIVKTEIVDPRIDVRKSETLD
jgi:organic hydroperoxide reductase OsmC/OhrA